MEGRKQILADSLFLNIPSGVGSKRKDLRLGKKELSQVLMKGVSWAIHNGFGSPEDEENIEAHGCIPGADPEVVSEKALERGHAQLGTLGSGNHFVEIGYVEEVYDPAAARVMGLEEGQVTVLIHTGSRGLGHQVCDDYLSIMFKASRKYGIELPDRQLCCAPLPSEEGKDYLAAMASAANFAFVNRHMIMHWTRESFQQVYQVPPSELRLELVYDVCHNIAKMERHELKGQEVTLCVHRKGATRAFPAGHPEIPEAYQTIGQPVLVPGDMGRCSYVLVGTREGYRETFGSACHGAGRLQSRHQAKKSSKGRAISREMEDKGIVVRAASRATLVEEIPEAYKDVSDVVNVLHQAGISKKVLKLRPLVVLKG